MRERPILFSGPMVRAILAGRKTVTRRLIKPQPTDVEFWLHGKPSNSRDGLPTMRDATGKGWAACGPFTCPYGKPGDRLWVKETYALDRIHDPTRPSAVLPTLLRDRWYRADGEQWVPLRGRWRPSIHMPRWASRLTLEVASVRVERLHDITEEDAQAEGCAAVVHEGWSAWDPETESYPEFTVEPDAEMVARRKLENVRHHKPRVFATAREQFRRLWTSINGAESWAANPWCWRVEFTVLPAAQ
ncbi:hypothetical protein GTY96_22835 [Corallococcus sp. c25j21]|nr:hypothetical protein [Corallococcus silvisoli]